MADTDLEFRRGGGGGLVLTYLPRWLFSLLSFVPFLPEMRGGAPAPPLDSPLSK